jgi:excinuclease ABC subunit C
MAITELKAQVARAPQQPGVYLFLNRAGDTLYVGKARALRDRLRSYLGAYGSSPRIDVLLGEVDRLETIVTDSVVEALALENHLIKQRAPRFNILLRDDKNYPYLQLTTSEPFPRLLVARRIARDGNHYSGPFLPASLARRTMTLAHRLFGIRSCNEEITGRRARPCLEYDIKRCAAPCVETICSRQEYSESVEHARMFLEGRNDELVERLRRQMLEAAESERFEQAAHLRDAIRTVEALGDRQQKIATTGFGNRDAFGIKLGRAGGIVQVFQMRKGRVIERVELAATAEQSSETEQEFLQAALQQFYEDHDPPGEVHVPIELEEREILESWMSGRSGRKVRIVVPRRGEKRELLDLATRNAALAYQSRLDGSVAASYDALETLRCALELPAIPRRIECFDVSTIQGSETVASLVVCEDGRMRRGEYRTYRVRGLASRASPGAGDAEAGAPPPTFGADDFAAIREVVMRRYRKLLDQGGPFPDLVVVDGGKGQLSAAYAALEQLGLANLLVAGLAKKEELLFLRDRSEPLGFASGSPTLLLLQRIRDEAHRVAVFSHRRARRMRDLRSELDSVPGIGPRRRRALLTTFGSLAGVRRASREELEAVVGRKAADAVLRYFGHG